MEPGTNAATFFSENEKIMSAKQRRLEELQKRTNQLIADVAVEHDAKRRHIQKALGEVVYDWLEDMDEADLEGFFTTLEVRASAQQRRLIQHHPARPEMAEAQTEVPAPAPVKGAATKAAHITEEPKTAGEAQA